MDLNLVINESIILEPGNHSLCANGLIRVADIILVAHPDGTQSVSKHRYQRPEDVDPETMEFRGPKVYVTRREEDWIVRIGGVLDAETKTKLLWGLVEYARWGEQDIVLASPSGTELRVTSQELLEAGIRAPYPPAR
jgi:hypothetical protein